MLPALLLFVLAPFQDPPAPAPEPAVPPAELAAPALDPAAHAAFLRMCERIDQGQPLAPLTSFRVRVGIKTLRDGHPNEDTAMLAWRAPKHVRLELDSGRKQGRGPSGYWLRDGDEVVSLVGRENADSRREIDELAAMCHNFAALARAREWKLTRLEPLAAPPADLPHALREVGATLEWLDLSSPDFVLLDETAPNATIASGAKEYRVRIGLVRADSKLPKGSKAAPGEPFLLLIGEQRGGIDIAGTKVALALDALKPLERAGSKLGLRVPGRIYLRRVDPYSPTGAFEEAPSTEIGLAAKDSLLGAELGDADFAP
ncbi:MAG: hypothetical protein FJ299_08925 [Planctomycetes bacterium]|nr:hypothetical protein [Planctomycetota bacterium]